MKYIIYYERFDQIFFGTFEYEKCETLKELITLKIINLLFFFIPKIFIPTSLMRMK